MIIYLSMILWVILMRIFCAGEMKYSRIYSGAKVYHVSYAVAALTVSYIIFWVGIRSGVADTRAYISAFENNDSTITDIPSILLSKIKGQAWVAIMVLFKNLISDNYHAWFMALSLFMGLAVARCYQKHSEAFFFCLLIFILNGNYTWMFNGMRQFFCVCTLMLALPWLIEGKTRHYMLLVAALSLVHFTVWLMVPLYFILRQQPWSRLIWLSMMAIVCLCMLAEPFASIAEDALQSTSYSDSTVFNDGDDGVHPLRVLVALVPAALAWSIRKHITLENNALLNICINASLLSSMLYLFGVFTSGIMMGRLPIYCEVFATIGLPAIINRFRAKNAQIALTTSCLFFYGAYYYATLGGSYYISDLTGLISHL